MSEPNDILKFSPDFAALDQLQSHCSTLEAFGKKVEQKSKSLRSVELLFSVRKADWEPVGELAGEILANSDGFVILSEGLAETVFRATASALAPPQSQRQRFPIEIVSSSLKQDAVSHLAQRFQKENWTLMVALHDKPSVRLVAILRVLADALSQKRHPEETSRRIVLATCEASSDWERWGSSLGYRNLAFLPRAAGRYLFFGQPNALLISLLGLSPWKCIEGGRSFFRGYEKIGELADPVLGYAALREVQLTEHYKETLVIPDESFKAFGDWWSELTEDSRRIFSEENNDGLVWTGRVMQEKASPGRRHWITEIHLEGVDDISLPSVDYEMPDGSCTGSIESLRSLDQLYAKSLKEHRTLPAYAPPAVDITVRHGDPHCLGGLFAFFEGVVSVSNRLAEASEQYRLATPLPFDIAVGGNN